MKSIRTICLLMAFCLMAGSAMAQLDPRAAQIISPVPGSTLPGSTVTFTWSPAVGGGDYFLQITQVPFVGQEIFYAVVRVESVTLVNLPTNGGTIYLYLYTRIQGQTLLPPFSCTYKAAGSPPAPAPTTTTVDNKAVGFSSAAQNVTLTATVAGGIVNQGTVTFQVLDGAANVGSAVTSPALTNGGASASYSLPGGTAAKSYTIRATYSGGTNFQPSSGTGTLTVNPPPPVAAPTTTAVDNKAVGFSSTAQNVTLTATVAGGIVSEGTVTFQVLDGAANVGAAVTSATLTSGGASVSYSLPGGTAAKSYTIKATYSGGTNFQASSGTGTLTVSATPPVAVATTTSVGDKTVDFNTAAQNATLTAAVAGGTVNQGTVTFQVLDGTANVGSAVTSPTLTSGSASVSYALPAGTAAKSYTIKATYSGGTNFQPSSGTGTLSVIDHQHADFKGFVPIVLDVTGLASARYTSELQLTNLGAGSATVALSYTGAIGSGSGVVLESVPAGQQAVYPDVISYLRSRGLPIPAAGGQGGTLAVSATAAGVRATVRTGADTVAPQPAGRSGLAYTDSDPAASSAAAVLYVHGLRTNDADRSKVAVYNMGPDPVSLRVTLVSGETGSAFDVTAGQPITLPAYGWFQYEDASLLRAAGFPSGYAIVERAAGIGPFGAYGVVNDQSTNDGSFIPALPGTFLGSRLTVPVLVETGAFESELILTNRGSATATFTLRYFESLSPAQGSGGTTAVDVPAGLQRIIPNAIAFLRSKGVAVGARGAASYAGSLQVQVGGVGLDSSFAGARTSSLSPAGGEFGLFYPAVGSSQEFSDSALVLGLKADASNRSNVAAIHTGAEGSGPITLEFQALDGSNGGTAVGQPLSLTLNPGGWVQPQGFFAGGGAPNGYVRIRRTAGAAPWYAYGVINDGGQPGQRTGDGSYVPGVRP